MMERFDENFCRIDNRPEFELPRDTEEIVEFIEAQQADQEADEQDA